MKTHFAVGTLLLLAACPSPSKEDVDTANPSNGELDADGDGFTEEAGDCDDSDSSINPDATEIWYDGIDSDCDGASDFDADGDGFDKGTSLGTDCDDEDDGVNPDAPEICNGVDDDCDGEMDESDAIDASTWFADEDGDGFGDLTSAVDACEVPDGYVESSEDCDDGDPEINPDGLETCDGVDSNCSGDESDASDADAYFEDLDGDGYGDSASILMACSDPGAAWVPYDEDCDDTDPEVSPSAVETCNNFLDDDCDGSAGSCLLSGTTGAEGTADIRLTSTSPVSSWSTYTCGSTTYTGSGSIDNDTARSLVIHPDITGDGVPDLVLARSASDGSEGVYILSGSGLAAEVDVYTEALALSGSVGGYDGKYSIENVGDLDGDGDSELAIGSYGSTSSDNDGSVYLLTEPVLASGSLASEAGATLDGDANRFGGIDKSGGFAGGGDANGDGRSDLIVGASGDDAGGSDAGAAFVFFDATNASSSSEAELVLVGENDGDRAGDSVELSGDFSGDGVADLVVVAPYADSDIGAIYIVEGGALSGSVDLRFADSKIEAVASASLLNASLAAGADLDGDGLDDLLVGSPFGETSGVVYLLTDPLTAGTIDSIALATYTASDTSEYAGWRVEGVGDLDGDGIDEFVATAEYWDGSSTNYYAYGAGLWFSGPYSGALTPSAIRYGAVTYDPAGTSGHFGRDLSVGDLDEDGVLDVMVSERPQSICNVSSGNNAYIFFGTGI